MSDGSRAERVAARIEERRELEAEHPRENRIEVLPAAGRPEWSGGAWPKGHSGNRRGRTPGGLALAERVRQRVNPDDLIDIALRIAMGCPFVITDPRTGEPIPGMPPNIPTVREQLLALTWIRDTGYSKPPQAVAVLAPDDKGSRRTDLSVLSETQLDQLAGLLRAAEGAPDTDDDLSGEE